MDAKDNIQYWIDRHGKHHNKLVAVGDIRRTEQENLSLYWAKKRGAAAMLRSLGLLDLSGRTVLDAGCGIGLMSELFSVLGAKVWGVDGSPVAIENARFRAPDGVFSTGSLVDFSLQQRFDLVYCADVLYHVVDDDNWRTAVMNLLGHVAPGGHLIIVEQLKATEERPGAHVRFRTRAMYEALHAERCGGQAALHFAPPLVRLTRPCP
ncbi:MAG: class I SAM-dependent methyltransferase [Sinimarinibacterium flocculans]|uniref:class I SAM-dependent methyltransferase n=1 Tax=Sinimarinibacterium flocculans TaxID=985250 RepID=UPI003C32D8F0